MEEGKISATDSSKTGQMEAKRVLQALEITQNDDLATKQILVGSPISKLRWDCRFEIFYERRNEVRSSFRTI